MHQHSDLENVGNRCFCWRGRRPECYWGRRAQPFTRSLGAYFFFPTAFLGQLEQEAVENEGQLVREFDTWWLIALHIFLAPEAPSYKSIMVVGAELRTQIKPIHPLTGSFVTSCLDCELVRWPPISRNFTTKPGMRRICLSGRLFGESPIWHYFRTLFDVFYATRVPAKSLSALRRTLSDVRSACNRETRWAKLTLPRQPRHVEVYVRVHLSRVSLAGLWPAHFQMLNTKKH